MKAIWTRLRDGWDIVKHAKNPTEILKAAVPPLQRPVILNEGPADVPPHLGDPPPPRTAEGLGMHLRGLARALEETLGPSERGDPAQESRPTTIVENGRVHYAGLRNGEAFDALVRASRLLHPLRPEDFTRDADRTAFWINLYNVLTIHGVIALGIRRSVMEIPSFFSIVSYRVGEDTFSLDDIENGVLRKNAAHPATGKRLFTPSDRRLRYAPSSVDPRIHAALVCAATSCPPIRAYDAERIEEQLSLAAENYVQHEVEIDDAAQRILLPMIFSYYRVDFGDDDGVHRFLLAHASDEQRAALQRARKEGYGVTYRRYDWSLNAFG